MLLTDYMRQVELTDKLSKEQILPVLLGLFGEVGSIMATAKKLHREKEAYAGYQHAVVEELGDALWYFTALCRRFNLNVETIFSEATGGGGYISKAPGFSTAPELDPILLKLGDATAACLSLNLTSDPRDTLRSFVACYLKAVQATSIPFDQIVNYNIAKTCGRFLDPEPAALPTFDDSFEQEEQIPSHFEIDIVQRRSGRSYLRWNGVFLGDPLTDNMRDEDGYRFHDVFHFAHASVLHWSPVFRALIKQKRKSNEKIDEAQDGGRAIVVEEGLTAWIFSRAKDLGFFNGQKTVSFDMLKTVQQFVTGYEVDACPLKLWEDAILQGYVVFRQVLAQRGGTVIGDRKDRKISYRPL
ncbi:MAG: nucleoside triphosphate pyrophosphohydrolase family protein [Candidatus Omnitrophica bacterium]|nr:nucleoside triphosphate pyrophosphohydrolase family protein [Candidatus Omnitrophota bacterium]